MREKHGLFWAASAKQNCPAIPAGGDVGSHFTGPTSEMSLLFLKEDKMKRCGKCANCKALERVQRNVLRAVSPPFSHADQGVIDLWNREVAELICCEVEEGKDAAGRLERYP